MKRITILFTSVFLFLNCFTFCSNTIIGNENIFKCTESIRYKNIILATFRVPEFQFFLTPHQKENHEKIVVLKNNIIRKAVFKANFESPFIFYSQKEIDNYKIKDFIKINSIKINDRKGFVEFEYQHEGVEGIAEFELTNCDWKLVSSKIVEH